MRDLRANAVILIAYLLAGIGSLLMAIPPGFLAPIWFPGAIGLSAVLLIGHRALPAIFIGTVLLTLPYGLFILEAGTVSSLAGSFGLAVAAALQAVIAKRLVQPGPVSAMPLETGAELARLVVFGAIVASMCGAALAAGWLTIGGFAPPNLDFWTAFARNWTGNAVGAAAVSPIILLLLAKDRVSRRRKRNVALVFVILAVISLVTFVATRVHALEERRESFAALIAEDHIALQERINSARRRLESLHALFAASETVTAEEFATYVDIAFSQFDSTSSVHWLVVDEAGRRPEHALLDPPGALRPDPGRGILIASDRRIITDHYFDGLPELVDTALLTGLLSATPLYGAGDEAWIGLALPAFSDRASPATQTDRRRQLQGLAVGTFRIEAIISRAFAHEGTVYDFRVSGSDPNGDYSWSHGGFDTDTPLAATLALPIGGQIWQIEYAATDLFLAREQDWVSWAVIVVGFTFITMLNALALLSTARTDLVQRLVEEKSAEALTLSNNLSLVLEHAADAILSLDGDGRGVLVNPAAAKLLGYELDELTGEIVHDIIHPVDMQGQPHTRVDCPVFQTSPVVSGQNNIERFRRKDGSDFFAEYSTEIIEAPDGSPVGAVTVLRDITARMEVEADRERFIEQLTRANEELERFAFAASHDLQEPLRLISNFTGLLASRHGDKLDENGLTYLRHTLDATARMQALITDLLAYGRLNSDADVMNSDVDLNTLVSSTLDTLGPAVQAARDHVEVGSLPIVRGNPARLGQLLQNLIGNAVKFQPPGQQAEVRISAREMDATWEIEIADNGIGIRQDYREQIFKPFKRLHSPDAYPGSGLGLAICRKIVASHGGVLTVLDNDPAGSIFRFTLPKVRPATPGDIAPASGTPAS
ncbi:ATP-binding protein [Maricaulis sp.]|uniref:ATP-binding protein n=1 Tax=Maricaulis sp. TaxID=1486257 RepID=UPI003A94041D